MRILWLPGVSDYALSPQPPSTSLVEAVVSRRMTKHSVH
jgi:hypothetical protein